jgi:hypothetical protein
MKRSYMKNALLSCPILLIILLAINYSTYAQQGNGGPQKIIIIRHGEKPAEGDNLSCMGQNRALMLSTVLYSKFKTVNYIFVPSLKTGKSTHEARMYQTIIPYAVKYNLDINSRNEVGDAVGLAQDIMKRTGTVLVVWEHNNIPMIASALGIKDEKLKWKGDDFDTIWIITFNNGKASLTRDQEGINPPAECK